MASKLTTCKHRLHPRGCDPMIGACALGHDIEAMVGPEKIGQALRLPCVLHRRSIPVECRDADHSDHAERTRALLRDADIIASGTCPRCSEKLVGTAATKRCPNHPDVFMMSCQAKDMDLGG